MPSQHVQEGKRYAAEINLAHFYEINHYKNKAGTVSIFMQDYEGEAAWPYLDKLICRWRQIEEEQRKACGLDPAPVYKLCELFRGQTRTADDLDFGEVNDPFPTIAPLKYPEAIPIVDYPGDPNKILELCEGDCDFGE